jgi:hypothetical protein
VEVTKGLSAGDRVVVEGILKVQPGALVNAKLEPIEGAPAAPPSREAAAAESPKGPS